MNYETIGKFISKKRKEKGFTQKELAEKIGVTDKAVSKWERGLGCPDVSILELLANQLDVSILEILKGRMVENEVIKLTEANDYVKESLNYSKVQIKEKLKIILSKLICFFIILIGTILIILNIFHYFYLNYQYDNIFNSTIFQSDIEKIEKNIKIIKNHQGIYNDEDYDIILSSLNDSFFRMKNSFLSKSNQIKKMTLNDLYVMDRNFGPDFAIINSLKVYKILEKYNKNIKNYETLYEKTFTAMIYLNAFHSEVYDSYKYQLVFPSSDPYLAPTEEQFTKRTAIYNYQISSFLYLTKNIIEIGEIYE